MTSLNLLILSVILYFLLSSFNNGCIPFLVSFLDNKYNKIEEEVSNIQNSINELKNLLLNYLNKENKN